MGKVVVGMTISLDGFVEDRDGSVARLYADLADWPETESGKESIARTGAVVMGRHTFAMGDPDFYADSYEYQVPIFVVTHEPPQQHTRENDRLTFTFVTDGVESAIARAKAAAGEKDVTVVGGASLIQQCLRAGLADELHVDIMPVLLGGGLRLFETTDAAPIELERIDVGGNPKRTALKFRVVKRA